MAKVTLYTDYKSGSAKEYANAHDIEISPAGVLTFSWHPEARGSTSVPLTIEEDVAVS
jgi:hypothetical protein